MKYIIAVNDGLYNNDGKNVFTDEELIDIFTKWSGGNALMNEDDDVITIEDLKVCKEEIWNEEMVEMGDEYVEIEIIKLKE